MFKNRPSRKADCQVVIATGNAACRKALPTRAGLKRLYPRPPKTNFPTATEKTPPRNAIQSGKMGGSVSPRRTPVMTADQSDIVLSLFDHLHKACSVSTLAITTVAMTRNAFIPKANTAKITTGIIAQTTFCMIVSVLTPFLICGEVLIWSVLLNICCSRFDCFTFAEN